MLRVEQEDGVVAFAVQLVCQRQNTRRTGVAA